MNFEEWLEDAGKEIDKKVKKDSKKYGGLFPINYFERIYSLYIGYINSKLTKNLVLATWILAIATIILVFSAIFFSISNQSKIEEYLIIAERTANATEEISGTLKEESANFSMASLWITITLFIILIFLALRYKIINKKTKS